MKKEKKKKKKKKEEKEEKEEILSSEITSKDEVFYPSEGKVTLE